MADVVIDASLNASAMESAINILVADVERKMGGLASSFDESVNKMEQSLKRMKEAAKESNSSKNQQEKQSVSALGESYDALAKSMQQVAERASKRWDSSDIQNYRMQLHELESEMRRLEHISWHQGMQEWFKVGRQIEETRNQIQLLVQEQEKLKASPASNRFEQEQRMQQYQQLGAQIDQLKAKESELVASHSRMILEFAKETPAARQLDEVRQKYDSVQQKIRDMGAAMMQNASAEEATIRREQQITEILQSRATAQDAYLRATRMPTNTYDEAVAKLERLKLVQEALSRNPILPESNILRLGRVIDETEQKIHKLESAQQQNAQATSATQNAINQQAQAMRQVGLSAEESARQVMEAEARKQASILQTGLNAQQIAQQIIASMHQQAMADSDNPIMGIKQLTEAITQMKRAYYSMGNEQESPIGQALRRDIENAERARQAIKEYNLSLMSLNNQDTLRNASFYELKEQIASLTDQYRWMTRRERESAQGRELIEKFQQLSKSANDVQRALNRPISLESALGLSASTLDEINYKMQMLRNYLGSINVDNNPKAANEIQQVNKALDDLKVKQQQILGQNKQLQDSNTWLARSFQYMKNRLAFYFTIGASTQFLKTLIEVRSQYEMTERALGVLIDSAERGSQIFNELSTMALQSPFTLIDLSNAAKQLTAYDVAAKDVVDTTRRLADMASAVGVNIDRLTYALGQVKAYGYLNARDARMFANAGIPLVKQLADYYTELEGRMVSVGDVYDRIKKKAIGYEETMAVITKMTDEGGKFFDFQAKMADTLRVQLANLTLAWNNMLNEIGRSNSSLLTAPIKGLKSLFSAWKQIEQVFKDIAWVFAGIGLIRLLSTFALRLVGVRMESYATAIAGRTLGTAIAGVGKAFVALMSNPWTWIIAIGAALADLALNASRVTEAAENLNAAIEKSADESIKSLKKFREVNDDAIKDLNAGLLRPDELTKLWDSIKEELENSADSSSQIIPQLMSIADTGERVKTALAWSERIDQANEALKNMGHNLIKINTDLAWGAFGEGVISDIKDWANAIYRARDYKGDIPEAATKYWDNEKEALEEIEKVAGQVAHTVETLLGEEGMKDRIKVGEAVARIKQQIKLENPEIQGEVARLFDIDLDQILGKRWGDVYDSTTTLWKDLMSEVKKDSSSAFQDLSQEWLEGTEDMTEEQKKAFTDAANHLKETLPPAFRDVLNTMMADLNSRDFRIRVGISFDTKLLDEVQKDFNKHFTGTESGKAEKPADFYYWTEENRRKWERDNEAYLQKVTRFNRKQGESDLAWEKRLTDEKKAQNDNLKIQERRRKSLSEVVRNDAEQQIADAKELIGILDNIADYEKLDLNPDKNKKSKSKTNKSRVKEEDLVAKALKEELSVINEMQSAYEKLRKAGVGTTDALQLASSGYDRTLKSINATLSKYGISPFKAEDFVGSADPHKLLTALQNQLDTLVRSGKVKTASLKDLEMEIKKITVDAKEFDMKKLTDGLNNELGKIKEEYELAVELDANPELGSIFADMMGISKDEIEELPKDYAQVMRKLQNIINQNLGNGVFNLSENLNKSSFEQWVTERGNELDDGFAKALDSIREYANKVRLDETKEIMQDWDKLLEKYAEYEHKRIQIIENYEKELETARKHGASADIFDAILNKKKQELAKLNFEEFQKSSIWITATGDLSKLSNQALQILIDSLVEFKHANKDLEPKQIQKINKALRQMRKEQAKDNPFKALSIAMLEADERAEEIQIEMDAVQAKINELEAQEQDALVINPENQKILKELYEKLQKLGLLKEEVSKIPFAEKDKAISAYVKAFKAVADSFKQIADSTNDFNLKQTADAISDVIGNFEAAEQGAQTWGGWWGAIIGGVTDAIPKILKWVSGNAKIDYDIQQSQIEVKKLTNFYKELEAAANKAYGVEAYGAQKAMLINKEFQLEALKAQLRLEKSRKKKYQDKSAIAELEGQIIDLKNEINEATENIVNDLLGISSKADFAESLVESMIQAFKEGEDYMKVFEDSFEDMVDNMIMKAIVSRLVGDWINSIWDSVNAKVAQSDRAREAEKNLKEAEEKLRGFEELASESPTYTNLELRDMWRKKYEEALTAYNNAITPTPEDIANMREFFEQGRDDFKNNFLAYMEAFGIKFGQSAGAADLSALQQGIQGITEDTAGALEAYMNSVSQQVYLHSDLLTQIRDILINFGGDITIATNAQILLQLQQSFQVQMTIQNVLTGVLNASGLAFRVELTN